MSIYSDFEKASTSYRVLDLSPEEQARLDFARPDFEYDEGILMQYMLYLEREGGFGPEFAIRYRSELETLHRGTETI